MVVSGCVGPRGDGYDPGQVMSSQEAESYHASQIGTFGEAGADMVTAITMTNANEAIGVTRGRRESRRARGHLLHPGDRRAACRPARACSEAIDAGR